MPISIGEKAPDFTLKRKTEAGLEDVTLSHSFGKPIVLLFVPAAFTGVCTEELCDASGGLGFSDSGAEVFGISVDSPFAQEAWAKQAHITIPLLSDYKHEVVKAYGVELPDLAGLGPSSARAAIVIGADGTVKFAEQTATPGDQQDFAKIKAALASA